MIRLAVPFLAVVLVAAAAPGGGDIDALVRGFAGAPGWQRLDAADVDARLLPAFSLAGPGAMRPDAAASPLEKALLLLDTQEDEVPVSRIMLRYGQVVADGTPHAFVTVERYNLGAARRLQLIEEVGEADTPSEVEFAVGRPHVAWRIVTIPLMGQAAAVLEVSRREIPQTEAEHADCLGRPCLDLDAANDDFRKWADADPAIDVPSSYEPHGPDGLARPARAAAELSVTLGLSAGEGGDHHWTGPEQPEAARGSDPFLFMLLDTGLGQEWGTDAVAGRTLLDDDSVAALWSRRLEVEGALYWFDASDPR